MSTPLPESWADEPWPLDDPVPAPRLRPTNWSDTHDPVPQVADLADEAQALADRDGISLGRALAEVQQRKHAEQRFEQSIEVLTEFARRAADEFSEVWRQVSDAYASLVESDTFRQALGDVSRMDKPNPPRMCPKHGQMTKGGYCRRCSR